MRSIIYSNFSQLLSKAVEDNILTMAEHQEIEAQFNLAKEFNLLTDLKPLTRTKLVGILTSEAVVNECLYEKASEASRT